MALENFMNALAGFGAGVKGDGQEFLRNLNHQKLGQQFGAGQLTPEGYLQELAKADPEVASKLALLQYEKSQPKYALREVGGKLLRVNENDPSATPEILYGGSTVDTKGEVTLRKEFEGLQPVKDFRTINDAYKKIESVGTAKPSATNDMALVFSLMKIYDPGSVVRETEYATAENARGVPDNIRASFNKLRDGQRLTPEQRENFLATANDLYGAQAGNYNELAGRYQGLATDYGYEPKRIAEPVQFQPRIPKDLQAPKVTKQEAAAPTIRNPKTGEVLVLKNGAWVKP